MPNAAQTSPRSREAKVVWYDGRCYLGVARLTSGGLEREIFSFLFLPSASLSFLLISLFASKGGVLRASGSAPPVRLAFQGHYVQVLKQSCRVRLPREGNFGGAFLPPPRMIVARFDGRRENNMNSDFPKERGGSR
jgi:hypothetical protein